MPNLFPSKTTTTTENNETSASQVKFGKSWLFDFEKGDFVSTPTGKIAKTNELEAYVQWCHKALLTPRYRHLIYSRNYGQEFEDLISRVLTRPAIESEIRRIASEALMTDPRTASVDSFTFEWKDDALYFTCEVATARGETETIVREVVFG